jgi:hypothetical protein
MEQKREKKEMKEVWGRYGMRRMKRQRTGPARQQEARVSVGVKEGQEAGTSLGATGEAGWRGKHGAPSD